MYAREASDLLDRMSMPNTTFETVEYIDPDHEQYGWLIIEIGLACLDLTCVIPTPTTVQRRVYISDIELAHMNAYDLIERVKFYLYALATHEVDEGFRVDGHHVTEPHPEYHGEYARCHPLAVR